MDHYLDIRLLPDPEFPATLLMSALFGKLHRGLAEHGGGTIGVSFPDVRAGNRTLGHCLRLHGSATELQRLMQIGWMQGLRDHADFGAPTPVPANPGYRVVRRVQAKSSAERLRRRLIARKHIDVEAAAQAIPDSVAERLDLPYVVLSSRTTGQRFPLFIEHGPIQVAPVAGSFTAYGLSSTATVPWF